jgi:glucose/arabinose dehydrogenase
MSRSLARRRSPFSLLAAIAVVGSLTAAGAAAGPPRTVGAAGEAGVGVAPARAINVDEDGVLVSMRRPQLVEPPAPTAFDPARVRIGLSLVAGGFSAPVLVTSAGDESGRLFVVEQAGWIRIISGGSVLATPFLDLRGTISTGGERGLLGLAFHPRFPSVPYVYVNFTDSNGNTAINRYSVGTNPNVALKSTGLRIISIAQPYANHNGGNIAFGPDGLLYIGMGDGGGSGDPGNRAQSLGSLLGKMLRIDVNGFSGSKHYRIPSTNPYVGTTGLDEIWSRGLRNPWRWSFDRKTGHLWIGDVGQGRYEEIDRSNPLPTARAGRGANYGWRVLEGRACYSPSTGCSTSGMHPPLVVYAHAVSGADNCSVTGGFVYRGAAYPILVGGYLFGDFCSGRMWLVSAGAYTPATPTLVRDATASPNLSISSFGESDTGELYVTDLSGGAVYRITASAKA